MHEGHRSRMRQRLFEAPESLADHELLEILLFSAYKQKNTNPIAHELLSTFGSLDGVLSANAEALSQVDDVGEHTASFLKTLGLILGRIREDDTPIPSYTSPFDFKNFLIERFKHFREEVFIVYFLNKAHNVISEFRFTNHNESNVTLDLKEIGRRINLAKPYAALVAHNHISGASSPTAKDDNATVSLAALFNLYNIHFYDHIIIAGNNYYSYELSKRLADIKQRCRFEELTKR